MATGAFFITTKILSDSVLKSQTLKGTTESTEPALGLIEPALQSSLAGFFVFLGDVMGTKLSHTPKHGDEINFGNLIKIRFVKVGSKFRVQMDAPKEMPIDIDKSKRNQKVQEVQA